MTDDPLHPQMRAVMNRLAEQAGGGPSRYDMPFTESRAALEAQRVWWQEGAPVMASETSNVRSIHGHDVEVRRYVPSALRTKTKLVFIHGGGFCVGSWRTHGAIHRWLAHEAGMEVLAIDYALAPEHPFPAAVEDVRIVVDELVANGERVVLSGDSAGANLALVDAMARRDAGTALPEALVLYYGTFGPMRGDGSFAQWGKGGFGLTNTVLERYAAAYAPDPSLANDPRLHPLMGDVSGLPRTLIIAAGCDPLLDDSLALHAMYERAGAPSRLTVYSGVTHGFLSYWRLLDDAKRAFAETAAFLHER